MRYERRNVRGNTVIGPPVGIDTIRLLGASEANPPVNYRMYERVGNGRWVVRNTTSGYCERVMWNGQPLNSSLNAFSLHPDGFAISPMDQNLTNIKQTYYWANGGGAFHQTGTGSTGSSEAYFMTGFDPSHGGSDGTDMILVQQLASAFAETFTMNHWTGGGWTRQAPWLDTQPTNIGVGGNRQFAIRWKEDGAYIGLSTVSGGGQNPATGGGGIHLYSISGTGAAYAGVRQTLSGYTPTAAPCRSGHFFNDGTTDYYICHTNGTAAIGATGEMIGGLSVFVRSGSTWTATANLINNGVEPGPAAADQIIESLIVDDDLYIGYWDGTGPLAINYLRHLKWNGTYFALQSPDPAYPPADIDGAVAFIASFYVTPDKRGVIIGFGGYVPTTVPTWSAYDRDPTSGALTYRPNEFDDIPTSISFSFGPVNGMVCDFEDLPNGVV